MLSQISSTSWILSGTLSSRTSANENLSMRRMLPSMRPANKPDGQCPHGHSQLCHPRFGQQVTIPERNGFLQAVFTSEAKAATALVETQLPEIPFP